MNKDKLYIDMPNEGTIETQIENIVAKGIRPTQSFCSFLKDMYNNISFRYLFYDVAEIIFIALVVFGVLIFSIIEGNIYRTVKDGGVYAFLFTVSPILYLSISLLSFIKAEQNGTYELKMTCKYDMYQVAVFRMLVFSILCILFNSIFVSIIAIIYEEVNFLRAFVISVTSLFLFSSIFLSMVCRIHSKMTKYLIIVGWMLINGVLWIIGMKSYINLLNSISIYIFFAVTAICIFVYIQNLKKLIKIRSVKGVI